MRPSSALPAATSLFRKATAAGNQSPTTLYSVFHRVCSTLGVEVRTSSATTKDGVELVYDETGLDRPAASTLVCIPGALGHARSDFTPQLKQLAATHRVVAFDPRGYGRSKPPERVFGVDFYERDADDVADLIRSLDNVKKVSVLGWSDGGMSAIIFAARYPELIDRMVLWGACAYYDNTDVAMMGATRDISTWSARMREPLEATYGGAEGLQRLWSGWFSAIDKIHAHGGDVCKKETKKVQCPVLVVHGDKDAMVPINHPIYLMKNLARARLFIMPNGKHNLHLRYAEEFNSLVRWFLAEPM